MALIQHVSMKSLKIWIKLKANDHKEEIMRKVTLIKTIPESPFNKALFAITPALIGHGTAHYIVIQIKHDEGNFFVIGHPCDSNGIIKNKQWVFIQPFENNEEDFLTALYHLIVTIKQSDQINKTLEEE